MIHMMKSHQLVKTELTESASFFSEDEVEQEKPYKTIAAYGLRENPKRSFKLQDPEFASTLERESEMEYSKNPTRKRSKRKTVLAESSADQLSSVSDTSPEEDLALCLLLLSRDANWKRNKDINKKKKKRMVSKTRKRDKLRCEKCMKRYRSSQALSSHKRICSLDVKKFTSNNNNNNNNNSNIIIKAEEGVFHCPYCSKLFGSGQALGGHKRSHLLAFNCNNSNAKRHVVGGKFEVIGIDLNLPASPEDDEEFSVVLEA